MPFDQKVFSEGLASRGYVYKSTSQIIKHRIYQYSDLDDILGKGWHFRGLNSAGDFSFIVPKTTEYYLRLRRPLCHFIPDDNGVPLKTCIPQGMHYTLHLWEVMEYRQTLVKTIQYLLNHDISTNLMYPCHIYLNCIVHHSIMIST